MRTGQGYNFMPPADPETAVRIVIEGVLMKLGDVLLIKSAKGAVLVGIFVRKRMNKTGGPKRDPTNGRKNKRY